MQQRLEDIGPAERPDIYEERIDSQRIPSSISGPAFTSYLRAKYATIKFDVVIAESADATRLLLDHPDLFPQADRFAIDATGSEPTGPNTSDVHLISSAGDWAGPAFRTIAATMPGVTRLVAIVDPSRAGQSNKESLNAAAASLPLGVRLDVWDDFSFDELRARAASLPKGSAILYSPVFQDRTGVHRTPRLVVQALAGVASVPIYARHDTFLGTGIVGGRLLSSQREGEMIADLTLGHPYMDQWSDPETMLNPFMFDEEALKRWNIAEARLPVPHVMRSNARPLWRRYLWQIGLATAAVVTEGLLILGLISALRHRKTVNRLIAWERDSLELRVAERTSALLAATRRLEDNNARLEHLASVDPLTEVANRRKFLDLAAEAWQCARRTAAPLSFMMLDIDAFKAINDRHGHATGDHVIRAVTDMCQTQLRQTDHIGRLGGEEFGILLPAMGVDAAMACAERIRHRVKGLSIVLATGDDIRVTVSVGVSVLGEAHDTLDDVIGRADAALYRAKSGGRDRVAGAVGTAEDAAAALPDVYKPAA